MYIYIYLYCTALERREINRDCDFIKKHTLRGLEVVSRPPFLHPSGRAGTIPCCADFIMFQLLIVRGSPLSGAFLKYGYPQSSS